jgi:curved DNA-binding protein CbpA
MQTLYDQLGARPEDDGESLKKAFRKTVKATHPDVHPDDFDAPVRFRQIVRAHAVLSDPELRAAYDRLLAFGLELPDPTAKRSVISDTMHKITADAIVVAVLAVVLAGGYALFVHTSTASVGAGRAVDVIRPAEVAAVSSTAQATTGRDGSPDTAERAQIFREAIGLAAAAPAADANGARATIGVAARAPAEAAAVAPTSQADATAGDEPRDRPERAELAHAPIAPPAVAADPGAKSGEAMADTGPAQDLAPRTAEFYRERGMLSYRAGDFRRAIADFDLAIELDRNFAGAYVDRGIVFYRLGEFDRAFADIAQAKRIGNSNRTRTPPSPPHRKTPSSQG